MNAAVDKPVRASPAESVQQSLYRDPCAFDFFQAVRLLEQGESRSGGDRQGGRELPRFAAPASTAFPASAIDSIERAESPGKRDRVSVNFMGLTGPSGALPRHYTDLLIEVENRLRDTAKRALAAWYDLFNDRLIGQFYRVWAKHRIDRGAAAHTEVSGAADPLTSALHSLIGLGLPALRNRLCVPSDTGQGEADDRILDAALARHAGTLARRQRSARQIGEMLTQYFRVPIGVQQFQGQWLELPAEECTRIGRSGVANRLGVDALVGRRVWDRQSRVRVRVGPLDAATFKRFLPDESPGQNRRRFAVLCQLVRLAIGPDLDFEVQLVLRQEDIPQLQTLRDNPPARLGWNTWLASTPLDRDGAEPVFEPVEGIG